MNTRPRFLVLSGMGLNCERESAMALELGGVSAKIVHLSDLRENPTLLSSYQGLFLPGGFSFGDELGSAKVLSLVMEVCLKDSLLSFVEEGKPILGICNGLQVLAHLGLLPGGRWGERSISLIQNKGGRFINDWVNLTVEKEDGPWFCRMEKEKITLPVRHGEGRAVVGEGFSSKKYMALRYEEDINGSHDLLAGLVSESGLILGMMPHPEAAVCDRTSPLGGHYRPSCDGLFFFKSIAYYLGQS